MTNLVDLDRALSAFLEDGPNTAPEAPVIAALAHARTTPRRPDPLGRFRSDVMAPRRTFGAVGRPGLALGLAALLIAGVGVAVIGSRSQEPSIVVPGQSDTPAPSVEPSPSSPSVSPFFGEIQLVLAAGQPLTVTVSDTTGALVAATSGTPAEGASGLEGKIAMAADPTDTHVLIAKWIGMPCETSATMVVDEGASTISISHPTCSGDTVAFDRVVRLTFRGPIDASAWNGSVIVEPAESLPAPSGATTHVDLAPTVDSPVSVDIVDLSGHLSGAVSGPQNEGSSVEFITASNVDARTVRLAWPGFQCDTVHRLTIAADLGLTIDRATCGDSVHVVERALILSFDRVVDADTLDTGLFTGRAGSGVPTWGVNGTDSNGGRFVLGIDDPGAYVTNVAGPDSAQTAAPGPDRIRLDQIGQSVIDLVWSGLACETTPRLTIDPTGSKWNLSVDACDGSSPEVVRRVSLKLGAPRSVDSITVETSVVVG